MPSPGSRRTALLAAAEATPGFLPLEEAMALHRAGRRAARERRGPLLEVGAYLGRSSLFLAAAICEADPPLVCFSLDHHRGSEEMQAGWPDHDPTLVDPETGRMDSLPRFRANLEAAGAEDLVVAVVGDSARVAANWATPLGLVFLDGGHGEEVARRDCRAFRELVAPGGLLVFHDVFEDPAEGGRAPYDCYRETLGTGDYLALAEGSLGSLRVLERRGGVPYEQDEPVSETIAGTLGG